MEIKLIFTDFVKVDIFQYHQTDTPISNEKTFHKILVDKKILEKHFDGIKKNYLSGN